MLRASAVRLILLVAAPAVVAVAASCSRATPAAREAEELARRLGQPAVERTFPARLSIRTTYRPCAVMQDSVYTVPRLKCDTSSRASVNAGSLRQSAEVGAAARSGADPLSIHAAGLLDLVFGGATGKSLDRSISTLAMASRLDPASASTLNDLSAAYFARARTLQSPADLFSALDAVDRALTLGGDQRVPLFNRALTLESLGLVDEAIAAWDSYIASSDDSVWASEAGARRTALLRVAAQKPLTLADPQATIEQLAARAPAELRKLTLDSLLNEWARAVDAHHPAAADSMLSEAERIGRALLASEGDATIIDVTRAIRESPPAARVRLAAAHEAYAGAIRAYDASDRHRSRTELEAMLAHGVSSRPLHDWATFYLAGSLAADGSLDDAQRMFIALDAAVDARRYPALRARVLSALVTTRMRLNQYGPALIAIDSARQIYDRIGERENLGALYSNEVDARFISGDFPGGYGALAHALFALRPYRSSVRLHNTLLAAAQEAIARGMPTVARHFTTEDLGVARRFARAGTVVEARLNIARIDAQSGDERLAHAELTAVRAAIDSLQVPNDRAFFDREWRVSHAFLDRRDRPKEAIADLDSAISSYAANTYYAKLIPAYVTRAEARANAGDATGARRDLDSAAALYDRERSALRTFPQRAFIAQQARTTYGRLAMLQLAARDTAGALSTFDRGRTLFDQPERAGEAGRQERTPGDVTLRLSMIGDTLVACASVPNGVRCHMSTPGARVIDGQIARAIAAMELGESLPAQQRALGDLYKTLLAPVARDIGPDGGALAILADDNLADVPFGALFDAVTGRYLIETHEVRLASRSNEPVFDRPRSGSPAAQLLVVADPAFDLSTHPGLARLPGALAESHAVAAMYGTSRTLAGADATRQMVLHALADATIIHVAGHAVQDDNRAERSALVLAKSTAGAPEDLTAEDISALDLSRVRLVVLSACETMRSSTQQRGGAFVTLSTAFLAAGAGAVVGSLWAVDDARTRALMTGFHSEYRKSGSASTALRRAQLEQLHSHDDADRVPSAWAAFQVVSR